MPIRLITFIFILLVIVTFIGFNIDNTSNIRFWFGESGIISDVPIFISLFFVYVAGVISVVPYMVVWKYRNSQRWRKDKTGSNKISRKLNPDAKNKTENETAEESLEQGRKS